MRYMLFLGLALSFIATVACDDGDSPGIVATGTGGSDVAPAVSAISPRSWSTTSPLPSPADTGIGLVDTFAAAAVAGDADRVIQMMVFEL